MKSSILPLAFWRRLPRPLRVAGPAIALALAAYAGLHRAPMPDTRTASLRVASTAPRLAEVPDLAEGFAWDWPGILTASAMYQCGPAGAEAASHSLIVWTDPMSRVLAFGASHEGGAVPAYALVLAKAGPVALGQQIHLAADGHTVHTSGKANSLQLGGTLLTCVPTWDD